MTRPTRRRRPVDVAWLRQLVEPVPTPTGPRPAALPALVQLLTPPTDDRAPDHLRQILDLVRAEAEPHYGPKASGVAAEPSNQVDPDGRPERPPTAVERHALDHDPTATAAVELLADLETFGRLAVSVAHRLEARHPGRAVRLCPRCEEPMTGTRCQRITDGVRCSTRADAAPARTCMDCGDPMPGARTRSRCDKCRVFLARNGYSRAGARKYAETFADGVWVETETGDD